MDDFYSIIKNITYDNIDKLCNINLSEMIDNKGAAFSVNDAVLILNYYLDFFGNNQIDSNNKTKLADFLVQSMNKDGRIKNNIWNEIYKRFTVQPALPKNYTKAMV